MHKRSPCIAARALTAVIIIAALFPLVATTQLVEESTTTPSVAEESKPIQTELVAPATTTEDVDAGEFLETTASTTGEVLGSADKGIADSTDASLVDSEIDQESTEEIIEESPPTTETGKSPQNMAQGGRTFAKGVRLDKSARHTCSVKPFQVTPSQGGSVKSQIFLVKNSGSLYTLEIGGLPKGIDVRFESTNDYSYTPLSEESVVELVVSQGAYARKGNFNIAIIYTRHGESESSAICQINIVNR